MNTDNFKTQDFWLSAFLLSCNVQVQRHERSGSLSTFWFEDSPRTQGLVDSYYKLTARIEPSNFGRAIRLLKRTMYDNASVTSTTTNGNTNHVKQSGNSVL
jgi:hypothetical protein